MGLHAKRNVGSQRRASAKRSRANKITIAEHGAFLETVIQEVMRAAVYEARMKPIETETTRFRGMAS